jgi:hypothetical protein
MKSTSIKKKLKKKKTLFSHYFIELQLLSHDSVCEKFMVNELLKDLQVINIMYSSTVIMHSFRHKMNDKKRKEVDISSDWPNRI